jgi:hypothetical protein
MKRPSAAALFDIPPSPSRRHHGRRPSDRYPHTAPVVNYRGFACPLVCWSSLLTLEELRMPHAPILVPARLRRPPQTGWSWVDRRFLREHAAHLSRDAVLLYFFLCAVADKHGLSFYGDGTMSALVRISLPALLAARDELLARDLIAHETRYTQVLALPTLGQRRRHEPGAGLMPLGDILRRAVELRQSDAEKDVP